MQESKLGWCALCRSRCGATFVVEDGKLASVGPDPNHPTGKALCVKGRAGPEILYSPDRILYPQKRTNPKDSEDPGWVRIGWDEALAIVGAKLREIRSRYGAEGIAFSTTTTAATAISDGNEWIERLIRLSGSPNWVSTTEICNWHRDSTNCLTYGAPLPYPDWQNTDLVVLWGFNPSSVWLDQATQVAQARARGAKVLVIDPRRFGFANDADHWLRVRPGSDGVLALGMIRHLMERGLFASPFLRRWSNAALLVGADGEFLRAKDLQDHLDPDAFVVRTASGRFCFVHRNRPEAAAVLAQADLLATGVAEGPRGSVVYRTAYDHVRAAAYAQNLDEVSEATWIPREKIIAAAEAIGAAHSVAYYLWTGLGQHAQSTQINRAVAILMSFTGMYDAPGGNVELAKHPSNAVNGDDLLAPSQLAKALGLVERPLGPPSEGRAIAHDFYTAVLEGDPYPVRGLVCFGSNLIMAHGDPLRGREAIRSLDFYVHCDMFDNPTSRYADIVLPVNTPYERDALRIGFGSGQRAEEHIQYRPKMVEPAGETRSDTEIAFAMANELGLSDLFFGGDIDAARAHVLEPTGITLDELKASPGGVTIHLKLRHWKYAEPLGEAIRGFRTETGLTELYSARLARIGEPGVPSFETQDLPGNGDYPFALTSAKTGYFLHSQHRNIASLRKREPYPTVQLAPDAAQDLGLAEDDWASVETEWGSVRMKVKFDPGLHPRVVRAAYGWWQDNRELGLVAYDPYSPQGANYNLLVPGRQKLDKASGTAAHRSLSCRVKAIAPLRRKPAWSGYRSMRVVAKERVADDVVLVRLASLEAGFLADYEPGQHLTLRITDSAGHSVTRCYSLVGQATEASRRGYDIAVRRVAPPTGRTDVPAGRMSTFINRELEVGDTVEARAPAGDFVISPRGEASLILVAGGIGITPMLSFLESIAASGEAVRIHLVYANRTAISEAFAERIAELRRAIPGLTVIRCWSRASASDADVKIGHAELSDLFVSGISVTAPVYFCGPPAMTATLRRALSEAGHPHDRVFEEKFVAPAVDEKELPDGPFKVTFARSGKIATWTRRSGSLLDLAEAEAIEIPSGCRTGQCETCRTAIVEGQFKHLGGAICHGNNSCLACQAIPLGDISIDA